MDRFAVFAAQVRFMFWLEIEGSSTDQAGEPSFHISLYAVIRLGLYAGNR
jgi:hypothetical protein